MDGNSELLNVDKESLTDEKLQEMYKELLQNPEFQKLDEQGNSSNILDELQTKVAPTPGCCIKTKNVKTKEKIFINVCTSSHVPPPREITETELQEMVRALNDDDETVDFRVPMSIGEPHAELDNQNKGCTAFDIVINPNYLTKLQGSGIFMNFFMSVVTEGIYNKYDTELDRNWVMLKRKKMIGSIHEQYMRKKTLIQEVPTGSLKSDTIPVKAAEKPKFHILKEPETGHPTHLIAEIELPKIDRAKAISLDVGEDRLVLSVKPHLYALDFYLPYKLVQEECGAQFHVGKKVLTVTMLVQSLE